MSEKKTGLGTDAFFRAGPRPAIESEAPAAPAPSPAAAPAAAPPAAPAPSPAAAPAPPARPRKVRTTVTLYPETLAALDELKIQARRQGLKATYSDILEEAISDLARKRRLAR